MGNELAAEGIDLKATHKECLRLVNTSPPLLKNKM